MMAIYVCSDIHGQYDLYKQMLDEIKFSDEDELYILGDVIDRGKDGIKILQDIIGKPNITCLMGNHELMMLHYFTGGNTGSAWRRSDNGSDDTLKDFAALNNEEQQKILNYLEDMFLQVEIPINQEIYLLSHSSFTEGGTTKAHKVGFNNQLIEDVVWNSPWRFWEYTPLDVYQEDGRIHIIGHVPVQALREEEWPEGIMPQMPCPYIDDEHHIINIDLGCVFLDMDIPEIDHGYLCVMNLTEYASGNRNSFMYFTKPEDDNNGKYYSPE